MSSSKPVRALFTRPSFAAVVTSTSSSPADTVNEKDDNFFSRRDPGLDITAVEKEQRRQRKLARAKSDLRSPNSSANSPTSGADYQSPKRRRISRENEDVEIQVLDGDSDDDEDDHIEIEEQPSSHQRRGRKAEPKSVSESSPSFEDGAGDAVHDFPMPNDDQCEMMRQENPRLAHLSNAQLRSRTRQKWEQEEVSKHTKSRPAMQRPETASIPSQSLRQSTTSSPSRPRSIDAQPPIRSPRVRATQQPEQLVINLDSDDEEKNTQLKSSGDAGNPNAPREHLHQAKVADKSSHFMASDDDSEEDEEMREHIRRTRKRIQTKQSQVLPTGHSSDIDRINSPSPATKQKEKALIYYWITSQIPGTSELKFKRRSDQRMKEARHYYCKQNGLADEDTNDKVVLIWVDQVWYDAMSAEDFKIGIDEHGNPLEYDGEYQNGSDSDRGQIHLVAMFESQWEEERIRRYRKEEADGKEDLGQIQNEAQKQPVEEDRIRVTLRAKSYEEQKISVNPSTTITRLTSAYRKLSNVPDNKTISLVFDGELLQPDLTVGQTEIEDTVIIDVHIK